MNQIDIRHARQVAKAMWYEGIAFGGMWACAVTNVVWLIGLWVLL